MHLVTRSVRSKVFVKVRRHIGKKDLIGKNWGFFLTLKEKAEFAS